MKLAADFRSVAREALRGKWAIAVLAGFIAVLLGAQESDLITLKGEDLDYHLSVLLTGRWVYVLVALFLVAVAYFLLGCIIRVGYVDFNLKLVEPREAKLDSLFAHFNNWKTIVVTRLLSRTFILLWSLLLIIPGIMAAYSYAMTDYLLAEHPEMTAREAIARSKELMNGNRFRLFCLQFSFIGWAILCAFTFGIGSLWLNPYIEAATAAFYKEISVS